MRRLSINDGSKEWSSPTVLDDVYCVALSPDGKFVAAGDIRGFVAVLDSTSGSVKGRFPDEAFAHSSRTHVFSLAFTPDSSVLVCAFVSDHPENPDGTRGGPHLYNVETCQRISILPGPQEAAYIKFVVYPSSGRRLVGAGNDIIALYDVKGEKLHSNQLLSTSRIMQGFDVTADAKRVAMSFGGTVIWGDLIST